LQIKPVSEHVGAQISDVNLATSLSNDTFEKIEDAYNRYSLLIFRETTSRPMHGIRISGPNRPSVAGEPITEAVSRIRAAGSEITSVKRLQRDHPPPRSVSGAAEDTCRRGNQRALAYFRKLCAPTSAA
jgi:alpha-ketoglutarate-dependent taurine dioxygenase